MFPEKPVQYGATEPYSILTSGLRRVDNDWILQSAGIPSSRVSTPLFFSVLRLRTASPRIPLSTAKCYKLTKMLCNWPKCIAETTQSEEPTELRGSHTMTCPRRSLHHILGLFQPKWWAALQLTGLHAGVSAHIYRSNRCTSIRDDGRA